MKKKPIGLRILATLFLVSALASTRYLFNPDAHIILFAQEISGIAFKAFYFVTIPIGIAIAYGLFKATSWAFWLFLAYYIAFVPNLLANLFFIDETTLISAGWTQSENLLKAYKTMMIVALVVVIFLILWVFRYKRVLTAQKEAG